MQNTIHSVEQSLCHKAAHVGACQLRWFAWEADCDPEGGSSAAFGPLAPPTRNKPRNLLLQHFAVATKQRRSIRTYDGCHSRKGFLWEGAVRKCLGQQPGAPGCPPTPVSSHHVSPAREATSSAWNAAAPLRTGSTQSPS